MTPSQKYYNKIRIKPGEIGYSTRHGGGTLALKSQSEVASILGISRQAVHQAERSAINKIRMALLASLREINPELAENFNRKNKEHP